MRIFLLILFVLFFFHTDIQGVSGAQSTIKKKELQRERKELGRIKSKISAEKKKITREVKREKSVLGRVRVANKKLNAYQKELLEYNKKLKDTNKKLLKIEAGLKKHRKRIRTEEDLLSKRLRAIYKEGDPSYLKVVVTASDPNDFLQRLKYITIIANYDAELISHYKSDMQILKGTKKELQKTAKNLTIYKKHIQKKKDEIFRERKKKQTLLYKIRNRKSTYEKVQNELLEASKELSTLISLLENSYLSDQSLTFHERKGFLPWPVKGKVITTFGKVKNKRFQIYTFNNGIEISAPIGKNIRAIHDGEVLHSGTLKGYGLMVILGHGKDYYSLYAHLSKSFVQKGDKIKKSQTFAHSGDSDSLNGPSLYFEIRSKRIPEDPLKWLSIAKK